MEDCGNYIIFFMPQGSSEWHEKRKNRLTMSNAASAIGTNRFETPEQLSEYLTGKKERIFSEKSKMLMQMGSERENEVREWYQEKYPNRKIYEIGFAVPKWNDYLGCSPDGMVDDDGIIEIKHTSEFYKSLLIYYNDKKNKKLIDYISPTHYAQIQGNLGILERKWCDYIVKEFEGSTIKIRVPFDNNFWEEIQKPRMIAFVNRYLKTIFK